MELYNTLTRRKEAFTADGTIKMYICGSTVYNKIHLGNARPMVVFDALRRYLIHKGMKVKYVTNFTDVDDKIIARALAEDVDVNIITENCIAEVMEDSAGLNCLPADIYTRVTEEMCGIIALIREIIEVGYAYELDGTVFFDTAAKADYGKLSGRVIEDMEAGARVEVDTRKRNSADFVLWKPAKPGEPSWQSPWGCGRPGWHIECSEMIRKHLGVTIDIHGGGADLAFPHHENELAQSEAANAAPLARFWLHNGMINQDSEKMSKSCGNFFEVRELAAKYGYEALRFYILGFHYRSPINFAPEHVGAAKSAASRIRNCVIMLKNAEKSGDTGEGFVQRFYKALADDFNTADAIAVIFELVKHANNSPDASLLPTLNKLCGVLGFDFDSRNDIEAMVDIEQIEQLLQIRDVARKNRDWARSDKIRDELKEKGVIVTDTAGGQKWHYEEH